MYSSGSRIHTVSTSLTNISNPCVGSAVPLLPHAHGTAAQARSLPTTEELGAVGASHGNEDPYQVDLLAPHLVECGRTPPAKQRQSTAAISGATPRLIQRPPCARLSHTQSAAGRGACHRLTPKVGGGEATAHCEGGHFELQQAVQQLVVHGTHYKVGHLVRAPVLRSRGSLPLPKPAH